MPERTRKPELHLVLVWSKAMPALGRILEDAARRFTVLDQYQVTWDRKHFASNLTRFYGQNLPSGSFKEKHCGTGPFRLIPLVDEKPVYGLRETSRGFERVNTNLFDAKARYREFSGGGHKVHTTNTAAECRHDLYLLLGKSCEELLAGKPVGQRPWHEAPGLGTRPCWQPRLAGSCPAFCRHERMCAVRGAAQF